MGDLKMTLPKREVLPNGTELNIVNGSTQDINELSLVFPGGKNETENPAINEIMALSMPEGAAGKNGAEISEAIDFQGARLSIGSSQHHTVCNVVSLNKMAGNVFSIVRDVLLEPTFSESTLDVMRERTEKELLMKLSKVETLCEIAISPLIKGANNLAARDRTVESIKAVTAEQVKSEHRKVIKADGCKAYLCGRVTDKLIEKVRALLMSLPDGEACKLQIDPFAPQKPQRVFVEKEGALQSSIAFAAPAPLRTSPDYIPLRMAVIALGGYFGSRLMRNIREDKGYTYGIHSWLQGIQDGSFTMIMAQADNSYVEPLIEEVNSELERLATEPMGNEELTRLRQYVASTLMEVIEGPFAISDYYRTKATVGLPDGYFERQVEVAKALSPELIMEMAGKYLRPTDMRIAVAGA